MQPTCETCGGARAEAVAVQAAPPGPAIALDLQGIEQRLRGHLYQELDLLAFALEMEATAAVERGEDGAAGRAQQARLGVRLAQRLVGAVSSPEVDRRLERWRAAYQAKFPG